MADFVTIGQTIDVPPGEIVLVELGDEDIAVANVGGIFYAFGAECTHAGGPLDEGQLEGTQLECPWHAGKFDIATGEVIDLLAMEEIPVYEVRVEGTAIKVSTEPITERAGHR